MFHKSSRHRLRPLGAAVNIYKKCQRLRASKQAHWNHLNCLTTFCPSFELGDHGGRTIRFTEHEA
jgi:hypothetical protein